MTSDINKNTDQDIKTLELAKLYESQGYWGDAHDIYSFLNETEPTGEIEAGLRRMEKKKDADESEKTPDAPVEDIWKKMSEIAEGGDGNSSDDKSTPDKNPGGKKISDLLEKWVMLLILKQRFDNFARIKARLL
jgi:hypothetical protein